MSVTIMIDGSRKHTVIISLALNFRVCVFLISVELKFFPNLNFEIRGVAYLHVKVCTQVFTVTVT